MGQPKKKNWTACVHSRKAVPPNEIDLAQTRNIQTKRRCELDYAGSKKGCTNSTGHNSIKGFLVTRRRKNCVSTISGSSKKAHKNQHSRLTSSTRRQIKLPVHSSGAYNAKKWYAAFLRQRRRRRRTKSERLHRKRSGLMHSLIPRSALSRSEKRPNLNKMAIVQRRSAFDDGTAVLTLNLPF